MKLNIVSARLLKTNRGFFSHAVGLTSGKAKNKGSATLGWMNTEKHSFSSKRHIRSGKANSGRVLSTKLEEYHSKTITNGAVGEDWNKYFIQPGKLRLRRNMISVSKNIRYIDVIKSYFVMAQKDKLHAMYM